MAVTSVPTKCRGLRVRPRFPTQLTRYELADFARRAKEMGVNYIGGCCGVVANHLRQMAYALGKAEKPEVWLPNPDVPMSETEFNWERRQD
ncbi:MAG: homocysteine S-methyltransferase family protein [Candidatus Poribacteria bacterium]|nr:homocysteine S-methyltransferase family protein [Candidatus Poribacteria bacterium]